MLPHEKISQTLRDARVGGRVPMVAFITAGFPRADMFQEHLREVCRHSDVVELGVPFSDPMADGVTIQRASHKALESGVSVRWILDQLEQMSPPPEAPILLMSYLNPLLAYGLDALAARARKAGVCGFIVPDLPLEESGPMIQSITSQGLALVQLVSPVTPPERIEKLCAASTGFVYAVTVTGITGGAAAAADNMLDYLDAVRSRASIPVCAGFGIRSAEQVSSLSPHVDGVIVGSALVEVMEKGGSIGEFLDSLQPA
jgi:tryptophan synthase alpha chain